MAIVTPSRGTAQREDPRSGLLPRCSGLLLLLLLLLPGLRRGVTPLRVLLLPFDGTRLGAAGVGIGEQEVHRLRRTMERKLHRWREQVGAGSGEEEILRLPRTMERKLHRWRGEAGDLGVSLREGTVAVRRRRHGEDGRIPKCMEVVLVG